MIDVNAQHLRAALGRATVPTAVVFARRGFQPSDELVASLRALEPDVRGRLDVLQIDVDAALEQARELVDELRLYKVPELLVWSAGGARLLARTEGAMRPDEVRDFLTVAAARA